MEIINYKRRSGKLLFENEQMIVKYIENDSDDLHSFSIDIKDFDTPLINIKYDKKKLKIVSKYIDIDDDRNEPKNHVAYKLIDLCKFELYEIFDYLIKHK